MNLFEQISQSVLSAILIAAITSWITVRLALRQFYSQKWWERKADAYTRIMEALYHVKNNLQTLLNAEETGSQIPEDRREELGLRSRESYQEIYKAEGIGAFIISEKASEILSELSQNLNKAKRERSWYEYLDENLFAINNCLEDLRYEAKRDLKIDKH
jgi:hypothetical protein